MTYFYVVPPTKCGLRNVDVILDLESCGVNYFATNSMLHHV